MTRQFIALSPVIEVVGVLQTSQFADSLICLFAKQIYYEGEFFQLGGNT
jgi:hypothetical protein